ncbi:MAG: hypothetical protein LBB45_06315 [Methanobrevibacter sp.]|jgi:hypothetical protein|nr:hypothetical protein [Candidatus Methanovirga basalitermitum]
MNKNIRYLGLISMLVLCFSIMSLGSAAKNTYWDNSEHLNQTDSSELVNDSDLANASILVNDSKIDHATQSLLAVKSYTYSPTACVLWSNNDQFRVRAYPSSYWDNWDFRAYEVTWNRNVWIDKIYQRDCENTEYITTGYIDFNPKGTAEGELTVRCSDDGKHDGCDFSAVTGFEKEKFDYHLSIWTSRETYPVNA